MNTIKEREEIAGKPVKVALEPVYIALKANESKTVADLLQDDSFTGLFTVNRGGGASTAEQNWLIVDGKKIGRSCAVLGAFYPHDNEDKDLSHFYKNGSYHIVIEKLKNIKAKAFKVATEQELKALEDAMMEGEISPKEWKSQKDEILGIEFKFSIDDETKAHLIELTKGYPTKEALAEAIADPDTDVSFKAIEKDVNDYLVAVEDEMRAEEEASEAEEA